MKKLKILFSLIALFSIPCVVGASSVERTTTLNLGNMDLTTDQENLSEGWKWDATNSTLTLTDVNFNVIGANGITLPSNKNIIITLVGTNKVISNQRAIGRVVSSSNNGIITINGNGSLEAIITSELTAIDLPNLTINSGKIKVIGGSVAALNQIIINDGELTVDTTSVSDNGFDAGIYPNGNFSMTGGKINLTVNGVGIFVPGIGSEQPLIGVNITGGKIDINSPIAAIYAGYKYSTIDIQKNVVIDGSEINFKDSNLGIYSAKGTISISKETKITAKEGAKIYGFNPENDVRELHIDSADYTNVDNKLASIPSDLSKYTDETVTALNNVKSSILRNKNFLEQSIVDGYVTALEAAINNLKIKTFNITTSINANGVVTLENPTNVEYGSTRELNVTTDKGYEVKSLKINGVDKTSNLVSGKLILSNITSNLEIIVEITPIKYEFVSGKDATYDGKELTFKLNGLYSLFDKLYINENELSRDNYTVVEGSTIITLKNEYLKTLSANKYRLKATYTNGTSDETTFTIKAVENNSEKNTTTNSTENNSEKNTTTNSTENNSEKNATVSSVKNPNTLDNILLYIGICLISIIGITSTGLYLKKQSN